MLSGLIVGLVVGLTGVGGGSLMTPLLVLAFGVQPATAVGTDLLYASVTKSVGTLVHGFNRNIDWRITALLASGSLPASFATIAVLGRIGPFGPQTAIVITKSLGCALLLTAAAMFARRRITAFIAAHGSPAPQRLRGVLTILAGALLGLFVSISSVGAGALGVTALVVLYPQAPTSRIVGSDIAHAVPLTLVAGLGHWLIGSVQLGTLGLLLCGSIPGIIAGSILAPRLADWGLRTALGSVLFVVGLRLVI